MHRTGKRGAGCARFERGAYWRRSSVGPVPLRALCEVFWGGEGGKEVTDTGLGD